MRMLTFLTVVAITATGCMSSYKGPAPDFSLKGEAAEKEFEKFQFNDGWWFGGADFYIMGPENTMYHSDSLTPIVQQVSPAAVELERRAHKWAIASLAVILGTTTYYLVQADDWDKDQWPIFYGGLLVGAGIGHYGKYLHLKGVREYNKELKQRFTPVVSLNIEY